MRLSPRRLLLLWLALGLMGCKPVGPASLLLDRSEYSTVVSESWRRQVLLNIIKLRYADTPAFMDIGQIVAGYTVETGGNAGAEVDMGDSLPGVKLGLGATVKYTDRPTITYTPLTGPKFIKSLMTPLPPDALFYLIQSGIQADGVLLGCTNALCGLHNQRARQPADPGFMRALALIRELQLADGIGLRIVQDASKEITTLITLSPSVSDLSETRELRQLLKLDPTAVEFKLVTGSLQFSNREIYLETRSLMQILQAMSTQVEVPPQDIADGRAEPGAARGVANPHGAAADQFMSIHSATEPPQDALVTVKYRGQWFYVDDRDLRSKRAFLFLMFLFTLADTGVDKPLPLITIPTQ